MDDVRGDFLAPTQGTTPAAVITNQNKMLRSSKSKENIHKLKLRIMHAAA